MSAVHDTSPITNVGAGQNKKMLELQAANELLTEQLEEAQHSLTKERQMHQEEIGKLATEQQKIE